MRLADLAILVFGCLTSVTSMPRPMNMEEVKYLERYGYITSTADGAQHTESAKIVALVLFQDRNGMNGTGTMTYETIDMMSKPRCSVKDILTTPSRVRDRRFEFAGTRWRSTSLTYRYLNYSPDLTQAQTRQAVSEAFAVWSDITPLTFREVTGTSAADIYILFQGGEHGDGNPFDGASGTLAHAYFPSPGIGGDAHFDESEIFSVNGQQGIDLFQVAAHEFGHSMGLAHSTDPNALMAPFYAGYIANFVLPQDDVNGIQALYGPNPDMPNVATSAPIPPIIPAGPTIDPAVCTSMFDAISFLRTEIFLFQGDDLWRMEMQGSPLVDYPRPISSIFTGLESNIDASYERYTDGTILFFKGNMYWEYNGNDMLPDFPRQISELGTIPNDIDATLSWGSSGYTYFFKGTQYWRYNEFAGGVDDGYPKRIQEAWIGVPDNLDAAFRWRDGNTYFVKSVDYWYFDVDQGQVDLTTYPRFFGEDWLGCSPDVYSTDVYSTDVYSRPTGVYSPESNIASTTLYSINVIIIATALVRSLGRPI